MIETFRVGRYAMRYGHFVPRLYNYCRSLGFERQRMLPSRAFCSDESQGYPVMLLAQHFGTFPFDHGRVGGKVAINRHGPYAHHGEDLVLIQASHVGYNPDDGRFGVYQRHRTEGCRFGDCCGKLCGVLRWYEDEYAHACRQVQCGRLDGEPVFQIDNQYLDDSRSEGVFLRLDRMVETSLRTRGELDFNQRFPAPHNDILHPTARDLSLDTAWVYGLIRQESRFISDARSGVGAAGLMQVMPATGKWVAAKLGISDFVHSMLHDVRTNITLGTNYMNMVLENNGGSQILATAAYNAGAGAVQKHGGIPPYAETRAYVERVKLLHQRYKEMLSAKGL